MKLIEGVDCLRCSSSGRVVKWLSLMGGELYDYTYCDCQYGQKLKAIRDMIGYHRRSNKG